MIPRLGKQFAVEIEVISKPRHEYQSTAYTELGLPKAPAIMIGDKVLVTGADMDEAELFNTIKQSLQETT